MRISAIARHGCALAILGLAASAAWSAVEAENVVLRYELQLQEGTRRPRNIARVIWKKGDRYRHEMTTPQGTQITVGGPKGDYIYVTGSKEATHVPKPVTLEKGLWMGLFGDTKAMRKAKKVGRETLLGQATEIYEQRLNGMATGVAPNIKGTTRVWLSPRLPMPFKSITTMEPNVKAVLVLKSYELNANIPDSLFELPKGMGVAATPMLPGMLPANKVPRNAWFRNKK
jgi:outer membrane lipoprotein-sorting protein